MVFCNFSSRVDQVIGSGCPLEVKRKAVAAHSVIAGIIPAPPGLPIAEAFESRL
jgi:hypothetical protein